MRIVNVPGITRLRDEEISWGTVGVSPNIIEASWIALVDSLEYGLLFRKLPEFTEARKVLEQLKGEGLISLS